MSRFKVLSNRPKGKFATVVQWWYRCIAKFNCWGVVMLESRVLACVGSSNCGVHISRVPLDFRYFRSKQLSDDLSASSDLQVSD